MSRSLSLFLFIGFLAIVAGLKTGGAWRGEIGRNLRTETSATVASIEDDMHAMGWLWNDARREADKLGADVAADSRIAAKHISSWIGTI